MAKRRIVVGISGGVDSAITAWRLKNEGFEVLGVHLKTMPHLATSKDILSCIADTIDFPIEILDVSETFNSIVINKFRTDHLAGRTPSPCTNCNPDFKWKELNKYAIRKKADLISSGHYIQKVEIDGTWYLKQATDEIKDQSYFLWGLNQEIIKKLYTPLGVTNKSKNKELAQIIGLDFLAQQKESTGLCFAQGRSYSELLSHYIPESKAISSGDIFNISGNVIGQHSGYIYYTIGQKKGLQITDNSLKNQCVIKIISEKNQLIAGHEDDLWQKNFNIDSCYFTNKEKVLSGEDIEVKVRGIGRNPQGYSTVKQINKTVFNVNLENPAWAMAPGQPVVFYQKGLLLGGGLMSH